MSHISPETKLIMNKAITKGDFFKSATVHRLPNIADGPQLGDTPQPIPVKTYALIRKVGGIYHIRLGRYRISICRVKG